MAVEIIFPRVDMDMESGRISRWLVDEGATVKLGEPLFEIETAKAAMEIEAPASGLLRGPRDAGGEEVAVGEPIGWIVAEGEAWEPAVAPRAAERAAPAEAPETPVEATPPATQPERRTPASDAAETAEDGAGARLLRATPLARRQAERRGLDLARLSGSGPNGRIVLSDVEAAGRATPAAATSVRSGPGGMHRVWSGLRDGTPLVLLHGFGSDLSTWQGVLPSLERGHRILSIDLPGHGRSVAGTPAGFEMLVDSVQAVLDEEQVTTAHLVGHSLGGAAALALAGAGTLSLRSLCLLAPGGLGPEIDGDFLRGFTRARQEDSMAAWLRRLFADPARVTQGYVRAVLKARSVAGLQEFQQDLADRLFPDGTQAFFLRDTIGRVDVPVKVIWGASDRIIPMRHGTGLPGRVGLHVVEAGHQPHVEAATLVASLISEAARAGA